MIVYDILLTGLVILAMFEPGQTSHKYNFSQLFMLTGNYWCFLDGFIVIIRRNIYLENSTTTSYLSMWRNYMVYNINVRIYIKLCPGLAEK